MKIARIEITHHQLPLDPPFPAAWDSQPRRKFPATIVRVYDDAGRSGIGSGDAMYGFQDYAHLFIGTDPLDLERHSQVLANIEFHAARPWPLEAALWDLAGKIQEKPVFRLLGGTTERVRAYASSGVHRSPEQMAALAQDVWKKGFAALKIRFGRPRIEDDFAVLAAVRQAQNNFERLQLLIDCNQGWRMPWDTAQPWDYPKALEVAQELAHYGVFWMEEPLHRGDYAGMSRLRGATSVLLAGGELTREPYEFRTLLEHDCLDVFQPDAVFTCGIGRLRELGAEIISQGKLFTPHTWGNGIGLLANLHLTAAVGGGPFLEFPYDPPQWSPDRRDFMLLEPIQPDSSGFLALDDTPGLGIRLDEERLAATLSEQATYR
jgi:L-alanine-DL-glutamate epimerase-like enolase superfamily enzyme